MSAAFRKDPSDSAARGSGAAEFDTGLAAASLDPERPVPVATPWGTVGLFVVDGEIRAFEAFCPHMEGPLFAGSIAGGIVTCPWHAWRYSLTDGARIDEECPASGPEARPLVQYGVRTSATGTVVLGASGEAPSAPG